jgi:hypothetical protein
METLFPLMRIGYFAITLLRVHVSVGMESDGSPPCRYVAPNSNVLSSPDSHNIEELKTVVPVRPMLPLLPLNGAWEKLQLGMNPSIGKEVIYRQSVGPNTEIQHLRGINHSKGCPSNGIGSLK